MKVFAHRGYHDDTCPENTLAAFQRAVDAGVDGIETDIRMAADGTALLFHDRCLPDGVPVSSLTRDELAARSGRAVPTLAEALSQGWDVEWDLELKNPEALHAAVPVLRPLVGRVRLFVSSFCHPVVQNAVDALGVDGGLLIYHVPLAAAGLGSATERIRYLITDVEMLTTEVVQMSSMRGFRTMAYGLITKDEHEAIEALDLEAAITDYPNYYLKG